VITLARDPAGAPARVSPPGLIRTALTLGLLAFAGYWSTLEGPISGDASSHVYLAYSFLTDGDAEIGECVTEPPLGRCLVWSFGRHQYAPYLPGNALLLTPLALGASAVGIRPPSPLALGVLAKLQASLLVSASVAVLFIALRRVVERRAALLLTLAYAFGTFAFAIASQILWEHAATLLCLCLALAFVLGPERTTHRAGIPVGLAVLVRPQNVFFAAGVLAYLWLRRRRAVPGFLAWGAPSAVFLLVFDLITLGSPFATTRVWLPGTAPLEGVAGMFVSPSRGLLVYGPFLLVALAALATAWREPAAPASPHGDRVVLLRIMSLVLVANVVLFALHEEWWGGWAFGNRYLGDLAPVYVVAIAHVWDRWVARPLARAAFAIAVGWAVLLQALGAAYQYFYWDGRHWDATPDIGRTPERLWSWTEAQWEWMLFRLVNAPGAQIVVEGAVLAAIVIAFAILGRRADTLRA
jgi:hypothetical protein